MNIIQSTGASPICPVTADLGEREAVVHGSWAPALCKFSTAQLPQRSCNRLFQPNAQNHELSGL